MEPHLNNLHSSMILMLECCHFQEMELYIQVCKDLVYLFSFHHEGKTIHNLVQPNQTLRPVRQQETLNRYTKSDRMALLLAQL